MYYSPIEIERLHHQLRANLKLLWLKAWPRMFYEHTLYSLRPPPETGVLLLLLLIMIKKTNCISLICLRGKWTYIYIYIWFWTLKVKCTQCGFVDKWPSRVQGQFVFWTHAGRAIVFMWNHKILNMMGSWLDKARPIQFGTSPYPTFPMGSCLL